MAQILVADDERSIRDLLHLLLDEQGHAVTRVENGALAIAAIQSGTFDLVLTDLKMPGASGLEVLATAKATDPATQVIVMTAYGTTETAVRAMKDGAADYITKPFKLAELNVQIDKALHVRKLERENLYLRTRLDTRGGVGQLVGDSAQMHHLYELIRRVARTRATVLITGESGTGKELVARAIHEEGVKHFGDPLDSPFVAINCGAIPTTLIESELFGHVKGAFTGASSDRKGVFEAARSGSLFLDEIGELPPEMQVKLLRVLQERCIVRVGSNRERDVRCRIIAATNQDLDAAIQNGSFRSDLFYRLNVVQISPPPLRERASDIPLLIEHFVAHHAKQLGRPMRGVTQEALKYLMGHGYAGNVRELENIILRGIAFAVDDMIDVDALPASVRGGTRKVASSPIELPEDGLDLDGTLDDIERRVLTMALERTGGVRKGAARLLGITFRSLRYRLAKHKIDGDEFAN